MTDYLSQLASRRKHYETMLQGKIGRLTVKYVDGKTYMLTGVNDLGILYWSKMSGSQVQKKQVVLSIFYTIDDVRKYEALRLKSRLKF